MNDQTIASVPDVLDPLLRDSNLSGFAMASEPTTGALLRVLAASKPRGRFLEIGTGTGIGTAWLLAGMDGSSHLDSVDNDDKAQAILLPQPSWPEGHAPKVPTLIRELSERPSFASIKLAWSTGLMLLVRTNAG